jgi:tripeptide aminopeptidase
MGKELRIIAAGGGSDANIFNAHGITSVIFATGMNNVHTVNEFIDLNDMHQNASFLLNTLALNSKPD